MPNYGSHPAVVILVVLSYLVAAILLTKFFFYSTVTRSAGGSFLGVAAGVSVALSILWAYVTYSANCGYGARETAASLITSGVVVGVLYRYDLLAKSIYSENPFLPEAAGVPGPEMTKLLVIAQLLLFVMCVRIVYLLVTNRDKLNGQSNRTEPIDQNRY